MTWLALLFVGFAITDLTHSAWHVPRLPEYVGAGGTVVVAMLAGLWSWQDLIALVAIVLLVLAWGRTVSRGFGPGPAWLPLALFAVAVAAAVLCAPLAGTAGGPLAAWLRHDPLPVLHHLSADRTLLILGGSLLQLSTGNVLVRLVLAATGTVNPITTLPADDPETRLKGGRLLGPMERLLILGLGLAGQLTAASIVVAAKGLLRFPELSSRREQHEIHRLSEYFLVGSFVSWMIALGTLVLLR